MGKALPEGEALERLDRMAKPIADGLLIDVWMALIDDARGRLEPDELDKFRKRLAEVLIRDAIAGWWQSEVDTVIARALWRMLEYASKP